MRRALPRTVVLLGLVSLLTDSASEMIMPLVPAFLTLVLGAGPLALGLVEGVAEAVASVIKLGAGRWADRVGRNRPFVVGGYGLSALVRPLIAVAGAAWHVVLVRAIDRVGKGLRTSPRDAMIAAATAEGDRGAAFGFHRGMDHAGAVIGPLLALAVLQWWTEDLRTVFWLAAVPGALAVLVALAVRDAPPSATPPVPRDPSDQRSAGPLWRGLLPIGLFTLGNASDLFLLLLAGESRGDLRALPLLWIGLHLVRAASAPLGGRLGDRIGHRRAMGLGWLLHAGFYLALARADPSDIAALVIAYGVVSGLTEGPQKALVAALGVGRRGTAFGWFHLVVGLCALVGSVSFGLVWERVGSSTAFSVGAALALVGVVALAIASGGTDRAVEPC